MVYTAKSDAAGTLSQFTIRKYVKITTGGTSTPASYQAKLTLPHKSEMQALFQDIRFNTKSGTYIDYWIESISPLSVSLNNPTEDGYIESVSYARTNSNTNVRMGVDAGSEIYRGYMEWDISSIPSDADITKVELRYHGWNHGVDCHIHEMITNRPSTSTDQSVYDEAGEGTIYADVAGFPVVGINQQIDLGATAVSDLQTALAAGWFAIGIQADDEVTTMQESSIYSEEYASANPKPTLYVEYSSAAEVWLELPDAITDPGSDTIWMYYGNAGLSEGGVGRDTFIVFDDFATGSSEQWTMINIVADRTTNHRLVLDGAHDGNFKATIDKGSDIGDYIYTATFAKTSGTRTGTWFGIATADQSLVNLGSGTHDSIEGFDGANNAGTQYKILYVVDAGTLQSLYATYGTLGTTYYITLKRLSGVHTYIGYTDSARTSPVWNVTYTDNDITNQRYVYGMATQLDWDRVMYGWVADIIIRKYIANEPTLAIVSQYLFRNPSMGGGMV